MNRRAFIRQVVSALVVTATPAAIVALTKTVEQEFDKQFPDGKMIFDVKGGDMWERVSKSFVFNGKNFDFSMWVKANIPGQYLVTVGNNHLEIKPFTSKGPGIRMAHTMETLTPA